MQGNRGPSTTELLRAQRAAAARVSSIEGDKEEDARVTEGDNVGAMVVEGGDQQESGVQGHEDNDEHHSDVGGEVAKTNRPPVCPQATALLKKLQDAIECIPSNVPLATNANPLSLFSGDPEGCLPPPEDDEVDGDWPILNGMFKNAFGWGSEATDNRIPRMLSRGECGLDGFLRFLTFFVQEQGLQGGLIEPKVDSLVKALHQYELISSRLCARSHINLASQRCRRRKVAMSPSMAVVAERTGRESKVIHKRKNQQTPATIPILLKMKAVRSVLIWISVIAHQLPQRSSLLSKLVHRLVRVLCLAFKRGC